MNGLGGNDTIIGADEGSADVVSGGSGDDSLNGDDGDDTLTGDGGLDTLIGGFRAESLNGGDGAGSPGGAGANTREGPGGADSPSGGDGVDRLVGGGLSDMLNGGAGGDVFAFRAVSDSTAAAADVIATFAGAGAAVGDLIDVSAIDPNTLLAGKQDVVFGALVGAGRLWALDDTMSTDTPIFGDVNRGAADVLIRIEDGGTLASACMSADFILV